MNFLDQCREKIEKATEGPWVGDRYDGTVKYQLKGPNGAVIVNGDNYEYGFISEDDAEFTAFSRQALPELVRRLDRAICILKKIKIDSIEGKPVFEELEAPLPGEVRGKK